MYTVTVSTVFVCSSTSGRFSEDCLPCGIHANLLQSYSSGFSTLVVVVVVMGGCSKFCSLVSPDFWSLVAFDMPLLTPTTFQAIRALLLSGSSA